MRVLLCLLLAGLPLLASGSPPTTAPTANASAVTSASPAPAATPVDTDALFELGQALFDEYAPAEVKEQFEFPRKEQWDDFATRLQRALESNDLAALAAYHEDARLALLTLRQMPGYGEYLNWLAARLDYAEAAQQLARESAPRPTPAPKPIIPSLAATVPHYDLWLARIQQRPIPPGAHKHLPTLRAVFAAEGLPTALAWLAEAESTFNPVAQSPVGAMGLFQLMPGTARELGLSTMFPDERTHPEKNARAAARYLRQLHGRFNDWPLTLAAYNAGPGRIRRTLAARNAKTFAEIAPVLPSETRMYVPKVLAILHVRAGVNPGALPPPAATSPATAQPRGAAPTSAR